MCYSIIVFHSCDKEKYEENLKLLQKKLKNGLHVEREMLSILIILNMWLCTK